MPEITDRPVLAGVDGSPESLAALDLAAAEASLRQAPLTVTYVWPGPHWRPVRTRAAPVSRADAERVLAAATAWLRRHRPDVPVTGRLVLGDAVEVLAAGSVSAQLVVVGHRGTGLVTRGWGSVAVQLSRRSKAPLIVRTRRSPEASVHGPVVVAVSAAPSDRTLRFAVESAARYGVPLAPCYVATEGASPAAHDRLAAALADWSARYPGVEIRPEVRHGRDVAQTLAAAAGDARLLVVGAGPGSALVELVRGSVSRGVLRTAGCPVAVVPEPAPEEPPQAATARAASAASMAPTSAGGSGLAK
jgi:nucleotide-binding universal stress UspA family protein